VISWFGDSMDGTLARYRQISTKHGFYLDHIVDAVSSVLICLGWGLSPYIRFDICLYLLIAYLMMSIRSYMVAMTTGEFKIAYAGVGGTELRVLLFLLNIIAFFVVLPVFTFMGQSFSLYDVIGIIMTLSLGFSFLFETIRDVIVIAKNE
jgi:archaetidylinositol phosphate synthase